MNNELPQDAALARLSLQQRKLTLLAMLRSISENKLVTISELSGEILNIIEEIDFRLESGNFWDE